MSHIPTWSHETWNFFTFVIWKHLWSLSFMKYWILSNIWKTCVNFPTRGREFAHRFHAWALKFYIFPSRKFELKSSDMRFGILSLSNLIIWEEMFSYEIRILKSSHVKQFPDSYTWKIIFQDSEIKI